MARWRTLTLVGLCLTAFAWAGDRAPRPDPAERLRQFQRDEALIDELVGSGIDLAGEDDPLRRAAQCRRLATHLTHAIRQAGAARESRRVAELSRHLEAVLESGVAGNLDQARRAIPSGSPLENKLREVGDQVKEMEDELGATPNLGTEELRPVLNAVRQGRAKIESAIKGPPSQAR